MLDDFIERYSQDRYTAEAEGSPAEQREHETTPGNSRKPTSTNPLPERMP